MDITKFDKRILQRNLKDGTLSQKEYRDYIKKLHDLEGDYEVIGVPLYTWEIEAAEEKAREEAKTEAARNDEERGDKSG